MYSTFLLHEMFKINLPSNSGADGKKAEIQKMLEELYERKDSLETEVEEQRSFMKCDQTKRAIEFILHTRKIEEIQSSIDNVSPRKYRVLASNIWFSLFSNYLLKFNYILFSVRRFQTRLKRSSEAFAGPIGKN